MGGHTQWEYKFVAASSNAKDVVQLFTEMGNDGWEYCGTQEFSDKQLTEAAKAFPDKVVRYGGAAVTQIFKRPKGGMMRGGGGGGGGFGASGGMGPMAGGSGESGFFNRSPGAPPMMASPSGGPGGIGGRSNPGANRPPAVNPGAPGVPAPQFGPPPASANANLAIIKLVNASASELAVVIEKVFPTASVTAEPRSNSLIIRAAKETENEIKELIGRLDTETDVRRPPFYPQTGGSSPENKVPSPRK